MAFPIRKKRSASKSPAYTGYHLQATRHLEVDLLYRYAWYRYSEGDRHDHNHTISLGLRYNVTDWLSVSLTSYAVWNRSNQNVFDYDSANAGIGLNLGLQF